MTRLQIRANGWEVGSSRVHPRLTTLPDSSYLFPSPFFSSQAPNPLPPFIPQSAICNSRSVGTCLFSQYVNPALLPNRGSNIFFFATSITIVSKTSSHDFISTFLFIFQFLLAVLIYLSLRGWMSLNQVCKLSTTL